LIGGVEVDWPEVGVNIVLIIIGAIAGAIITIITQKINERKDRKAIGIIFSEKIKERCATLNHILESIKAHVRQHGYSPNNILNNKINSLINTQSYFDTDTYNFILSNLCRLPSSCSKSVLLFFHTLKVMEEQKKNITIQSLLLGLKQGIEAEIGIQKYVFSNQKRIEQLLNYRKEIECIEKQAPKL